MNNQTNILDSQQALERLARSDSQKASEISVVASPGEKTSAWAAKVKSLSSYNVYNVRVVAMGDPGSVPVEIGAQMKAVNLAESFLTSGILAADTYILMCKVGEKNVFYALV